MVHQTDECDMVWILIEGIWGWELRPVGDNTVSRHRRERSRSIPWMAGGSRMMRNGNRRVLRFAREIMGNRPTGADPDVFGGIWDIGVAFHEIREILTFQADPTDQVVPFFPRRYVDGGIFRPPPPILRRNKELGRGVLAGFGISYGGLGDIARLGGFATSWLVASKEW